MIEIIQNFSNLIQIGNFSWVLLLSAFLGGVLASLSPCSLGILPIIIGYIGGYDKEEKPAKTLIQLISFVFGLSAILSLIGVFCALSGRVFMAIGGQYWIIFMASLILVLGLNLLGVLEIPIPHFVKKMPKSKGTSLFVYPFILGFLFALAATPCSTPILAAIMGFAALSKDIFYSILLLFLFSLGQGVVIIAAGVFASFIKSVRIFNKYNSILMKACGVLLILSSIFIYYAIFSPFINISLQK